MTIKELIEKRAKVWETAKSFVDTHEDKNGLLSAEDTATYNKMEKEIEDLTAAIDRQQRAAQREADLNKPLNSPLTNKPYKGEQSEKKSGRATDEYKNAMLSAMRSNFRNISNVLQEGVDADGGYLVPEEYDSRLIDVLEEETLCVLLQQQSQQAVSTKLILLPQSLRLRGLKRAAHSALVMQPLTRFILMHTNSMLQSR